MESNTAVTTLVPDQAKAEYARVLSDPTHEHHAGLLRRDPKAEQYVDELYRKAYGSAPINFSQGIEVTGRSAPDPTNMDQVSAPDGPTLSREDRFEQAQTEARLQSVLGDEYSGVMREAGIGAATLFSGPKGLEALDLVAPAITALGVHAEVLAIRFLSELGRLWQSQQGGSR